MSPPPAQFLITGSTSGLGASILNTLYTSPFIPNKSVIAAASSRPGSGAKLQEKYPGIQFRVVDYDDAETLVSAFEGVEKLFFVSSPERDGGRREVQHGNVVRAAGEAGVGRVGFFPTILSKECWTDADLMFRRYTTRVSRSEGMSHNPWSGCRARTSQRRRC